MYDFLVEIEYKDQKHVEVYYKRIKANGMIEAREIATKRFQRLYCRNNKKIFEVKVKNIYIPVKYIKEDQSHV